MEEACNNIFRPAGEIVSKAMRKHLDTSKPYPSLSNPSHLARTANRHRQKKRPTDPTELCLTLDIDFIGQDFLQSDIHVRGNRHLIFATTAELDILFKCRHWLIDSTFKVVRKPFYQLFSIHGFVKSGDFVKQVPLLFSLMSSRKKRDYKHVLQSIVDLANTVVVEHITVDYEHAIWRTIPKVFPTVTIHGCGFHWAQAVRRQVQAHGLQIAYRQDCGTHRFIRKLLAM
ncbi:hypothetical protein Pmani_006475 [Petrolisthes manimaculis]|uniref:MULE transposase domain-containing protein n=1 Tax=Petrolisthes manimaculis TaxID=1843537 RepID=A0AAE1QAX3_9EUCA|nr:hypothetical protein Pmani_006475 [Petrolisthes manimaculis]